MCPSSGAAKVGIVIVPELAKTFLLINGASGDGRTPVAGGIPISP